MKLKYTGPFEGVEIPVLGIVVARGESAEITGDVAEELLKRDDWTRVDRPKTSEKES